jgi:hypothetical protein
MDRMRAVLKTLGLTASPHEAPRALAQRIRQRFGSQGDALAALLDSLERQRYSRATVRQPDSALTREFVVRARALSTRR